MDNDGNYATSFKLLKSIGFYQMVDPNSPKMFGYNIYHLIHIFLVVFTSTVAAIGLTGLVYNNDELLRNRSQDMQIIFSVVCLTIGNIKVIIIICNADKIWKTFDIERQSFFSNKYYQKTRFKIKDCREHSRRTLLCYIFIFYMTAVFWILLPIIMNIDETATAHYIRKINVINLKYPIKFETYNTYYNAFYVTEAIFCGYCIFGLVVFDIFILGKLHLISTQYEILSSAYENIMLIDKNENLDKFSIKNYENELLSITSDCQNIYKNLKIICKISRPIVLIYMVGDSNGMITLPYIIVMCYINNGSSMWNAGFFTNIWTLCVLVMQLYMFCSLFQRIDDKKEYLGFGLYRSDWTTMDIKFKKRMLLAMRMHNTIKRNIMRVSPTKYIGLSMLAAIVQFSYRITYVMINSDIHNFK